MGIRERAELFGIHAPDIPAERWFDYLEVLEEFANEGPEPFEPEWD